MESFHTIALRPLRHYADFSGRSRRSDVVAFGILNSAARYVALAVTLPFGVEAASLALLAMSAALLCPWCALLVRRLHDSGRSGWWALIAAPTALDLWYGFQAVRLRTVAAPSTRPSPVDALSAVAGIAVLALLFWNDDPQPNRYGPNPRYDPPDEAQLA